ncbi:MAG: hypothetical protein M1816_002424 [Peltula sp. TS41687]|nr:MAG: hypothetical protein M1816_002424 [Peltula sp. TS41687]
MAASADEIRAVNVSGPPIQVLVISFKVSAEGLGTGWCRIRRIGQTKVQRMTRLVNWDTLDVQVEKAMVLNAEPIVCAMQAVDRVLGEERQESGDGNPSSLLILDFLIGRISDAEKPRNVLAYTVLGDEAHDPVNDPEIPRDVPPYLPSNDVQIFMNPQDKPEDELDLENWD